MESYNNSSYQLILEIIIPRVSGSDLCQQIWIMEENFDETSLFTGPIELQIKAHK